MAQTPRYVQAVLGTSVSAVYTTPASKRAYLIKVLLCNYSQSSTVTWSAWVVPSGQSVADQRRVVRDRPLPPSSGVYPGGTEDARELVGIALEAGDSLRMAASAASSVAVLVQVVEVDTA
jgi:hypothetical protein